MKPFELWSEPWEGLDPSHEAWEWDFVSKAKNGATKNPPSRGQRWVRWYFTYHQPVCTNIRVSADKDPSTGSWFNPHPSSAQP
jgi:hypothetical protein